MKKSTYVSRPVDENGCAHYTPEEDAIWSELYTRQVPLLTDRACDEFINGLDLLKMSANRIPQCPDISKVLRDMTGWALEPVPALIPFDRFFQLLSERKFPAATFVRRREELDYLQEPDIFHEVFGHCPLLTHPAYAEFTELYGKLGLKAAHTDRVMLARLYWFTIEFGLMQTPKGLRAYGGGILSSKSETIYAVESDVPLRKPFDPLDILRTPYRIDIMQPVYFIINSFDDLFTLTSLDLIGLIQEARHLGMHEPLYPPKSEA